MKFHVCWTIDCESCREEVNDLDLGRTAIAGFANIMDEADYHGTFFLMPEEVEPMADLLKNVAQRGHELALHLHPDQSGYPSGHLGVYAHSTQREIIQKALDTFETCLGTRPVTCRPGFMSANDATFSAMHDCGIRQASASMPERRMSTLASNWSGAPLFAHYVNPHNRFLTDGLDLVEIPVSVDWQSMIWGGVHPQDLRVEFTDAKNHGYAIEKIMQRQVQENLPLKALVPLTHNRFRYSDLGDFRRQTMAGMIETTHRCARSLGAELVGTTIADAATAYRKAVPFE